MFVVMTVGASEAEILGVKSQILAEGLTPFDHVGEERTVIAVGFDAMHADAQEQFAGLKGEDFDHPMPPIHAPAPAYSRRTGTASRTGSR